MAHCLKQGPNTLRVEVLGVNTGVPALVVEDLLHSRLKEHGVVAVYFHPRQSGHTTILLDFRQGTALRNPAEFSEGVERHLREVTADHPKRVEWFETPQQVSMLAKA